MDQASKCVESQNLTERLRALRDALSQGLVEREVAIRLGLLACLAGEHLLLLGPPGTAKSLVARRLHLAFSDSAYFERLLTRFTVPEELFGPLSIRGLEEDRYERLTEGYLPKAAIAFLDEVFKANSAILNALLTLLNEREFDNGTTRQTTPLVAVIGASNELTEGDELDALFDRFLLRLHVGPVDAQGFVSLIRLRGQAAPKPAAELQLTTTELRAIQAQAESVAVPADIEDLLVKLREFCAAEGMQVSDRRWRKLVKLLQVSALTNGRETVSIWDCWLLQHCLWDTPESRKKLFDWYAVRVGAAAAMNPERLTKLVTTWEALLGKDQKSQTQLRDEKGRLLHVSAKGAHTVDTTEKLQRLRDGKPLYLGPSESWLPGPRGGRARLSDRTNGEKYFTVDELDALYMDDYYNRTFHEWDGRAKYLATGANRAMGPSTLQPAMEPTRYSEAHVQGRLGELNAVLADAGAYREKLLAHIASFEAQIRSHLWVTPEFAEPARQNLEETRRTVEGLLARLERVRAGFAALPREHSPL
jgi:MoxR-like ATPase